MSDEIQGRGLGGGELPDDITKEEFLELTKPDLNSDVMKELRAKIRERREQRLNDEDTSEGS